MNSKGAQTFLSVCRLSRPQYKAGKNVYPPLAMSFEFIEVPLKQTLTHQSLSCPIN